MLRVVSAAVGKGGVRVLSAAEVPVPEVVEVGQAASFGAFLRSALRSLGLRGDRVVLSVPRQDAVLNPLTLPPTADNELANMVRFQVAKELPFSLDQAVVDFAILRQEGGGRGGLEVLVAAVRNHIVEYYKAVAEEAGLTIERIGLRPHANVVAVTREAAHQKGRVVLVDVGPLMTEIDVIRDGGLAFSSAAAVAVRLPGDESAARGVPASRRSDDAVIPFLDAGDRGGSSVDELLVEITRKVAAYRASDPAAAIDRVIVAGSCGIEEALSQAVGQRLQAPTSIYRPPDDLIRQLERRAGVKWGSFGAALGLAWGQVYSGTAQFDFVHPKEPVDARKERMRKVPVVAGAAAVLLLAVGTAVGYKMHNRVVEIRNLDAKLKASKEELDEIKDFNTRVNAAEGWRQHNIIWLDEFRAIAGALPPTQDAYLRELSTTDDGEVVMKMVAADATVLEKMLARLTALKTDKGKRRFLVTPGARVSNKDTRYKIQTDVRVQLESMVEKPASRGTHR
jgi:type IV pilus assembly protein PilM